MELTTSVALTAAFSRSDTRSTNFLLYILSAAVTVRTIMPQNIEMLLQMTLRCVMTSFSNWVENAKSGISTSSELNGLTLLLYIEFQEDENPSMIDGTLREKKRVTV
jgi:hypothetical protein